MTDNAYTFLPWLRAGINTRITTDPGAAARATVHIPLNLSGEALDGGTITHDAGRPVQMYGPGDVVGVDPRAISRAEPRPGTANVEPNFLAHIEFVDEDFPWRYSPAPSGPATARLTPWVALVVLAADTEFTDAAGTDPLPAIDITDPVRTMPPADQLGAWAHVHVNGSLADPVATDSTAGALTALDAVLTTDPDSACSRLICPRHLRPETAYEAFLVPAFETGRLAGLGFDPAGAPSGLYSSWGPPYANRPVGNRMPYYHRWAFRTGTAGDFEFLVRQLQPQHADARVGRREIDVHDSPGFDLDGIPDQGGVLPLGGALRVPETVDPADNWDHFADPPSPTPLYPHPFEQALARVINLADDFQQETPPKAGAGPDPIVTPPLYGRWHALTSRLLRDRNDTPVSTEESHNWVHRLNLDPRFRVAANLGAQVVKDHDEELMAAAWAQVGDVLVANGRIRAAQLAREVGHVLQTRHLELPAGTARTAAAAAPSGRALTLTAPAHSRVTTTLTATNSLVAGQDSEVAVGFHVAGSRVAAAPVSPAMRRIIRPGSRLMRSLDFAEGRRGDALLFRMDDPVNPVVAAPVKITPGALVTPADVNAVLHPDRPPGTDPVDVLAHSPDFVLRAPGDPVTPHPGTSDSAEATRFKTALRELHQGIDAGVAVGQTPRPPALDLTTTTTDTLTGLRSDTTVPRALLDGAVSLPERLRPFAAAFTEAMAYPVFDIPMFRSLIDISLDAFVPNLNLLPPNSLTLLDNNHEFIESYMAGLNHEMAREMLWREFPTDQRGTPFRQFWDPVTALPEPGVSPADRRERDYDIPPMHLWPTTARLGENANPHDGIVLVVRGELLRKYPTTAIYAHRAEWPPGADGLPDKSQPRRLVTITGQPTTDQIQLPRFEATVDPDIYLIGFGLTADKAVGGPDDPGWFFVLKERPGDPRFGLDDRDPGRPAEPIEVWNDLTWSDVDPAGRGFVTLDPAVTVPLAGLDGSDDAGKLDQHAEDENLPLWFSGLGSADLAYILLQVPVMVAVHAQEMVPR
ncbi:hypothetical protein [Nonomuraea sp. NEAU-A123]|uniref:hypothetical protein n=1 Tax=Nonomuraea sp. NEAU-A123 TaxID=2839649 RepID=UPI001BE3D8C6|nr:hypothetical protein [Nonomuraea sp. NEAU-A123]MBT2226084.1 hypothetical protein [Nonomuraea sp. NEAU-A123]